MAQSLGNEWEAHREHLKELWLDRGYTAKEIQKYMHETYGFYRRSVIYGYEIVLYCLNKKTNSTKVKDRLLVN